MKNKLIQFSVLALIIVGTASCELYEMVKIPASQDVSIDMDKEAVNNTDVLRCEVNVSDVNGTRTSSYSGIPMIQFNLSSLEVTKNDIGVLLLKAESIKEPGNESAIVAMMPAASDWNENSSYNNLFFNLIPGIEIIQSNNIAGTAINTDGDRIFAFDVSKKLLDAKDEGGDVSFILMAVSNSSYSLDFNSRESGEGPYLMVMPYPARPGINKTSISLSLGESMVSEIINDTFNEAINDTINETTGEAMNDAISAINETISAINQTSNRTSDQNKTAIESPDDHNASEDNMQERASEIGPLIGLTTNPALSLTAAKNAALEKEIGRKFEEMKKA